MKSSTLLDSAVFHLTPTRTRCDLIIMANGKQEKIASGLLNPFVAHLKTAEEQIAKGGYSIILEPHGNCDPSWFTKGTLERFVRFVSTPEILERVYTIESEILQIEEAIVFQGSSNLDHTDVTDNQAKPLGNQEGNRSVADHANEEKAIILYKPGMQQPESNHKVSPEGNSKVQLLKVLETRKSVLQKEQGMAFARAVAAGFDFECLAPLLSFAESFGAIRLMDACTRFLDLWRKKQDSGQWLEVEAPESMLNQSEYFSMSKTGIMLTSVATKQSESSNDIGSDNNEGERPPNGSQVPSGHHEHFQGHFPHPMFAPWPVHSPPGTVPLIPAYTVQGMPYYPTYPGNGPFYHPSYPANGEPRYGAGHKTGKGRQSVDDKDSDSESEKLDVDASQTSSQDATELTMESRKKAGRSGKKKSGVVVIRNINYITSKGKGSASTESESESGSECEAISEECQVNDLDKTHKISSRSSNRKEGHDDAMNKSHVYGNKDGMNRNYSNGDPWQAFQNFLLSGADPENNDSKEGMFAQEKDVKMNRHQSIVSDDPLALGGQDLDDSRNRNTKEIHEVGGTMSRRLTGSNDQVQLSGGSYDDATGLTYGVDMQSTEANGKRVLTRTANDDFLIGGRGRQSDIGNLSDPLSTNGFDHATPKFVRETRHDIADESFIVPLRSLTLEEDRPEGRTTIDMDSELPSTHGKSDVLSNGIRSQTNYEPDALSLMPERGAERRPSVYDPALEYDLQVNVEGSTTQDKGKLEETNVKEVSKKSEKERKSRVSSGASDRKRTGGPIRKEKPTKMNLLEDARARAEKLRSFKADMQKMKKEKEEADQKRLEALKLERQKRIAARANSASPGSALQTRKLPSKLSPISHGGSKFSDTEPGASSPLQRSKIRTTSLGSSDSRKTSKTGKVSNNSHVEGNRLTRSVSSLSESRKESSGIMPDSKASMAAIKRLSEPKTLRNPVISTKARSAEPVMKRKSNGPDNKKISAIINLDKSKAETLPELKIRTSERPSDVAPNKSLDNDSLKTKGAKSSLKSEDAGSNENNGNITHCGDSDDNPVIEKTVVMLEYEKPSLPHFHQDGEKISIQSQSVNSHATPKKCEVHAALSTTNLVGSTPDHRQVPVQSRSCEGSTDYGEKVSIDDSNSGNIAVEKPYQAPYARNSSWEDPGTGYCEYDKAPQVCSDMRSTVKETAKAYVSDDKTLRVDTIPEALERTQVKESSKGFRRLLKFGKKNHTSSAGDRSLDLDNTSVRSFDLDDSKTSAGSSREVFTLKNLISQDVTPSSASASQKSSRHFSLFSSFRGKSSEKKLTT